MIEDFDPKIGKQSNIEIPFVTPVNYEYLLLTISKYCIIYWNILNILGDLHCKRSVVSIFCQSSVQTGWRLFGGRSRREGELWSVWVDGVLSSSSLSSNSSSFVVLKIVIIKIIINTIIIVIIAFWRTTSLWSKATLSLQLWVICTLYKKVQTGVSLSIQSQTSSNPSKRFATI